VLHLAAEDDLMRKEVFRSASLELCDALTQRRDPKPQLGQTREQLQLTAQRVYQNITSGIMALIEQERLERNMLAASSHDRRRAISRAVDMITKLRYCISLCGNGRHALCNWKKYAIYVKSRI